MPITEAQRLERRKHLGSSDMAAVLRLSPWRTPFDVWAEKTARLQEGRENEAMRLGTRMEPIIIDLAEAELGPLERNVMTVAHPLVSNADAVVIDGGAPVEAKTSGIQGPIYGEWGEAGTDEIPESYIIQAHVHMICLAREICHVPAILGGRGYLRYVVPLNRDVADVIQEKAAKFWRLVEMDTPPEESYPSAEISKLVCRTPGVVIEIPTDEFAEYTEARGARLLAEKIEDYKKSRIMARMDAARAEAANIPGLGSITYFEESKKSYTVPEWTGRVFRVRKKSF